jgi:hypothetical protein
MSKLPKVGIMAISPGKDIDLFNRISEKKISASPIMENNSRFNLLEPLNHIEAIKNEAKAPINNSQTLRGNR